MWSEGFVVVRPGVGPGCHLGGVEVRVGLVLRAGPEAREELRVAASREESVRPLTGPAQGVLGQPGAATASHT